MIDVYLLVYFISIVIILIFLYYCIFTLCNILYHPDESETLA